MYPAQSVQFCVQYTHFKKKNDAVFEAGLGWAGRNSIAEFHQQTEEENGKQRRKGGSLETRI